MNQIGSNVTLYSESSLNEREKLDRNIILGWLKDDITYLRDKAKKDNPGCNIQRIQLLRTSIYGCSVALAALKDTELEDLVKDIEEIKKKVGLKT